METLLKFIGKDIQEIDFEPWLEGKPDRLKPIATKWFAAIKKCGLDVQDIFHDGCPVGCVDNAPFAYVNVFKSHVNLGFFYGVDLPDKMKMLEGTGKRMRHIKLRPDVEYDDKEILSLIHASYLDIKDKLLIN